MNKHPHYIGLEEARQLLAQMGVQLTLRQMQRAAEQDAQGEIHQLLLLAMVVAGGLSLASAQELRPVANPEQLGFSSAHLQRLTETYQGYIDRGELPGAVLLIARGEKIAYLQAVGYQDREKKTPMKVDAIFRLASMTKPIVSVAAMMLVEEGKLDLLAPVAQYLPEFKDLNVGSLLIEPHHASEALPPGR